MTKIVKVSLIILVVAAFLLQALSVYFANTKDVESLTALELKKEIEELKEKNIEIETKILEQSSYKSIASRAAELGYNDKGGFVSLYDPIEIAIGR